MPHDGRQGPLGRVSYDDYVTAYFSYCWSNGAVWNTNGWDGQNTCQLLCSFTGFDNAYTFGYGRHTRGHWSVLDISHVVGVHLNTSASACVQVDGWGNAWQCGL